MRAAAAGVSLLLAGVLLGCPGREKAVVYDLADRVRFAERWSSREVVLFGTPSAEPYLADGFYRESVPASTDGFVWGRRDVEIALQWPVVQGRAGVVELAPYEGVAAQRVAIVLNETQVAEMAVEGGRRRYRFGLPAAAQRAGDNRLRFHFTADATPASRDPKSADERKLAAAFHGLVLAPSEDAGLDDLLARGAPAPFAGGKDDKGVPLLTQVGPSVIRYGLRVPEGGELRLTPDLHPTARASGVAASFRITVEGREGGERELWARVIRATDRPGEEVSLRLPGQPGEVVRLGLWVGSAGADRFAWGTWKAPRVTGTPEDASAAPPAERVDTLRKAVGRANVILIVLDAGRAQNFGCYGYGRATTPEIDRIAAEGVVFEQAYTPAVYTLAAMSSLWTSQYPDRHHSEVAFSAKLPKDRLTLAELLGAQGIRTAGFVANSVAGRLFGFDRGFDDFEEVFVGRGSEADSFREVVPPWLAKHKDGRFFAYVHFREPHHPYDPPAPFDTRFGPEGPIAKETRRTDPPWYTDLNQERRQPRPGEIEHLVSLYDGNLAYADQEIGRLRRELEQQGLWERSVVMVAADHGEALYEHGWIGHNVQLYEESTHIPLVMHFPKEAGLSGLRLRALTDLLDLAPTIADVMGALGKGGSEREFQGRSLLNVLAGGPGKKAVLSRSVWDRPRYAFRDGERTYLYDTRTGGEELYERASDPQERRNLAPGEPVLAAYYRQALQDWIARLPQRKGGGRQKEVLDPEQCANLRALGYISADCPDEPGKAASPPAAAGR